MRSNAAFITNVAVAGLFGIGLALAGASAAQADPETVSADGTVTVATTDKTPQSTADTWPWTRTSATTPAGMQQAAADTWPWT